MCRQDTSLCKNKILRKSLEIIQFAKIMDRNDDNFWSRENNSHCRDTTHLNVFINASFLIQRICLTVRGILKTHKFIRLPNLAYACNTLTLYVFINSNWYLLII